MPELRYSKNELEQLCREYHVLRLAVFGSMVNRNARESSDLDLLVEFDPKHGPGWDMFALEESLSKLFGHAVDLNTPGFISRYFREDVLRSAENLYAR